MRALLSLALCLAVSPSFAQKHKEPVIDAAARVGQMTRVFHPTAKRNWRGAKEQALRVLIWYPAASYSKEQPLFIGAPEEPLFEAGTAALNAEWEPALRKFPLVLLSHGTGGSAEQMAWLGTALARAGFIAVAVTHPGNNSHEEYTPEGFTLWWERATDLSNVLDALLADPDMGPRIDQQRIAAAGFSLGGYTVMELAGARTDVSVLYEQCRKNSDAAACRVPEMKQLKDTETILQATRKTSGESLARSGDSFRDARIAAVFAMAPAIGEVLTPESLHAVRVPVEIEVGDQDRIAPAEHSADYLRANLRSGRENTLPGVAHYTFLDSCTALGRKQLGVYCDDPAGTDRAKVHGEVAEEAVTFFRRALKMK